MVANSSLILNGYMFRVSEWALGMSIILANLKKKWIMASETTSAILPSSGTSPFVFL